VSLQLFQQLIKLGCLQHFISKPEVSSREISDTVVKMKYALACKYLNLEPYLPLKGSALELEKLIYYRINKPEKFGVQQIDEVFNLQDLITDNL
jgi:hypothetical protein